MFVYVRFMHNKDVLVYVRLILNKDGDTLMDKDVVHAAQRDGPGGNHVPHNGTGHRAHRAADPAHASRMGVSHNVPQSPRPASGMGLFQWCLCLKVFHGKHSDGVLEYVSKNEFWFKCGHTVR